jgi:hypothetical protein
MRRGGSRRPAAAFRRVHIDVSPFVMCDSAAMHRSAVVHRPAATHNSASLRQLGTPDLFIGVLVADVPGEVAAQAVCGQEL